MKKIDKKIYKTIDFQANALTFALIFGGFLLLLITYVALLINFHPEAFVVFVILHLSLFFGFALWFAIQLILLSAKSGKFSYYESSEFSIVPDSMSFRGGFFCVQVVVDGKTYTTERVVNANNFARATELNKLEIGVIEKDDEIEVVVVKPN